MTSTTIKRAIGKDALEKIELVSLDEKWNEIPNTNQFMSLDALCISVGLSPMHQLLSMVNAETKFINELGGFVPVIDQHHQSSIKNIFVCGEIGGAAGYTTNPSTFSATSMNNGIWILDNYVGAIDVLISNQMYRLCIKNRSYN